MNYPCMRCIVEYLEANQRFQLASKCPEIRSIERSIPLHLDRLAFGSDSITINQSGYNLKKTVLKKIRHYTPGDIAFYKNDMRRIHFNNDDEDFSCSYQLVRYFRGRNEEEEEEVLKNFPEGVLKNWAMKWMGCFFFEGRQVITTRELDVLSANVLRLPADFKVKVINRIETSLDYLDGISEFVHPKVEEIVIFIDEDVVEEHSFIRNAQQVSFKGLLLHHRDDYLNFTHKNVKLTNDLPVGYFERLIRKWIADEREIGSFFSFITPRRRHYLEELNDFKKKFGGRAVDRKVTKEEIPGIETQINHFDFDRFEKELEYKKSNKGRELLYCICLPMNSASELQISLFGRNQLTKEYKIDMEVVPIQSLPTLEFDQVEYQIKKDNFKDGTICVLFLLVIISFIGTLIIYAPCKRSAS